MKINEILTEDLEHGLAKAKVDRGGGWDLTIPTVKELVSVATAKGEGKPNVCKSRASKFKSPRW